MRVLCDIGSPRYSMEQNKLLLNGMLKAFNAVAYREWSVFVNKAYRAPVPHARSEATVAALATMCYTRARTRLSRKPYMSRWNWDDWMTFYLGIVQNLGCGNAWAYMTRQLRDLYPIVFSFGGPSPSYAGGLAEAEQSSFFSFANRLFTVNMIFANTYVNSWVDDEEDAHTRLNEVLARGAGPYLANHEGEEFRANYNRMADGLPEDADIGNFEQYLRLQGNFGELPAYMF